RQVRREVIGQVLDYSSRIWSMSIDDFETRWRARTGESAFEVFGVDASAVRSGVESALRDGSFTLVLAVDAINDDLRRIVEYLNAITRDDVSILAFEATRFAHGRVEILMPRVYGAELVAMKDRRRRTNSWTPQEFLTAAGNDGDEVAVAAGLFLDEVRAAGFTLFNGTATHPNVIIGRPDDGYWPVSLYSNPVRPRIRLHDITDARGPELATACASRLIGIPGAKLDPEKPNIRAKLTLTSEALTDPSQRARFFDAMKLLAQGVHKGDAGAS
ncbi:MAG: hypothetical protein QG597_3481, partial [Actinomycetota bacterium]|nr:hypothetical protein [Actinomycetota bacterium]